MSGGSKWREPNHSPDWTDIFSVIRAMEAMHSVTVFITLSSAVYDGSGGFTTISAHKMSRVGEASVLGEPAIISSGEWPCPHHRDYAACLYAALLEMDGLLSRKLWEQIQLPFTAE